MKDLKPLNIYIHIPYCKARCRYCNFYVVAGRTPQLPLYFKALKRELESYGDLSDYEIKTIYFGGGTPSLVDAENIGEVISYIKSRCNTSKRLDISIEMNPENITKEKLDKYYAYGIRRVSVGLQAWQDGLLKYMGRLYTIEEFLKYFELLKNSRIKNINIDLIFGVPGQTLNQWKESVNKVIDLNPQHVSCYSLEVDERSIYGVMEGKGLFKRANENLDREMYMYARRALRKAGFEHYEISNFAKPGYKSKHNFAIWNGEEYIGLGASAHSYFKNQRFNNIADVDQYVLKTIKSENPKEEIINIDKKQAMLEFIVLQLRLIEGLDIKKYNKKFGEDFQVIYSTQIQELDKESLATIKKGKLKLSDKGLDLENYVISKFI